MIFIDGPGFLLERRDEPSLEFRNTHQRSFAAGFVEPINPIIDAS